VIIPNRERPATVKGWTTADLTSAQAMAVHNFMARGDTAHLVGTPYEVAEGAPEPALPPCVPGCPRCAAYWLRGAVT
jgi:hypothetical protein